MSSCVFDASAVLAVLNRERGHEIAEPHLFGATISTVNYGEVLKKSVERGGSIPMVQLLLAKQDLRIVPFDVSHSVCSAEICPAGKAHGLSFADRACLSLGLLLDLPIVTAEEAMKQVNLPIKVKLIRK
ncbi:MAG: type II toxin-antitoxin system VapC family toxin [Planctomycetales bacterium]|nr:type II toxin-antitoxin system VapC family toxin [Planctomycetales bacterium]